MTHEQILAILADIKIFDRLFVVTPTGPDATNGWHLQVTYNEADVNTGKVEQQYSRKWYIADDAAESDVVDTAFAAVMRSYDHVVQEHFTYKGKRIFSPHFTVAQRLALATTCPVCEGPHDDTKHHNARARHSWMNWDAAEITKELSSWSDDAQRQTEEVLRGFEHWLNQGMFAQVDDLLQTLRIDRISHAALIAVLSITFPAKDKLKRREAFFVKVETKLRAELGSARAEDLLRSRR